MESKHTSGHPSLPGHSELAVSPVHGLVPLKQTNKLQQQQAQGL